MTQGSHPPQRPTSQVCINLHEWASDLEVLRVQAQMSMGKDSEDAKAIVAAWEKALAGFAEACRQYAACL